MNRKPVYRAGQGFQRDDPASPPALWRRLRWWALGLASLLGFGLCLWLWPSRPLEGRVRVLSEPPGAEILLDLRATGLRTPAELAPPPGRHSLLQVRLAGYVSRPLALRLDPLHPPREVRFQLEANPAPRPAASPIQTPSATLAPTSPHPAVGLAPLLEEALRQPAGVPEHPDPGLALTLLNWDASFQLSVDGRPLPPAGARHLPAGVHRIRVELAGRAVLDTVLRGGGPRSLLLPPRERFVEVRATPAEAEIVLGDRLLGRGRCLLRRSDLPLSLRFPSLAGWLPPAPLSVEADAPATLSVQHREPYTLSWAPGKEQGLQLTARGYRMPGRDFTVDSQRGAKLEGGGLLLGRAFHDRRPGGAQAARFSFEMPAETQSAWPVTLELLAGDSGQREPLVLTRGARLTLSLNGTVLARDLTLEEGEHQRGWPVANLLKPGRNELLIQSGEDSRSASRVSRLRLKVGT